jgi:hypothetical protein
MKFAPVFLLAASGLGICCGAQGQARMAGYETYAIVAPVDDEASATPFAEVHCAKYNRFPRFRRMDGLKAIFDCETHKPKGAPPLKRGDLY